MAINFPNSPAVNDTFTVGGINFTFTGVKWESGAVVELSSDTTPSLGGDLDGGAKNINNVGVITATGLDVNGNADISGNLSVHGTTTTIDTAVTEVDSLAVEGSVGIGTDNPAVKLDIVDSGSPNIALRGSSYPSIRYSALDGTTDAEIYYGIGGNDLVLNNVNAGPISFKTTNTERLHITSDGKVMMGQSSSSVNRNLSITGVTGNSNDAEIGLQPTNSSGGINPESIIGATADGAYGAHMFFTTRDTSGNRTERLRISSSGSIGIGTINPGFKLDVDFTRSAEDGIRILNRATHTNSTSMLRFGNDENINAAFLQLNSSGYSSVGGAYNLVLGHGLSRDIVFSTGGTERLRVNSTGITATGTVSDSKGDLRKIPFKQESSAYTLVAADAGKAIEIAAGGITVPTGVFGSGDAITIINDSGSSQSITMGAGLGNMFNSGTGTSGNLTLAGRGMATIYFVNNTTCYISGGGLS